MPTAFVLVLILVLFDAQYYLPLLSHLVVPLATHAHLSHAQHARHTLNNRRKY